MNSISPDHFFAHLQRAQQRAAVPFAEQMRRFAQEQQKPQTPQASGGKSFDSFFSAPHKKRLHDPMQAVILSALRTQCILVVQLPGGKEWTGSGFHVGEGYVVTAGHVAPPELADHPYRIWASFNDRDYLNCELVLSDPTCDAAILRCDDILKGGVPAMPLADSDSVEVGDLVAVVAAPEGFSDVATGGMVAATHKSLHDPKKPAWDDILFIEPDIYQGASGGMVLLSDGSVVGIIMGVTGQNAETGTGLHAACPSNKILRLLSHIGPDGRAMRQQMFSLR